MKKKLSEKTDITECVLFNSIHSVCSLYYLPLLLILFWKMCYCIELLKQSMLHKLHKLFMMCLILLIYFRMYKNVWVVIHADPSSKFHRLHHSLYASSYMFSFISWGYDESSSRGAIFLRSTILTSYSAIQYRVYFRTILIFLHVKALQMWILWNIFICCFLFVRDIYSF